MEFDILLKVVNLGLDVAILYLAWKVYQNTKE